MAQNFPVLAPISEQIWDQKYRLKSAGGTPVDTDPEATFARVARAVAAPEHPDRREIWTGRFLDAMRDFSFLPAGRILAGAGAERSVTLFNCFVMGTIEDDMASIFDHVKEAALTMQQGGGIGHDFSTLRPKGALVAGVGAEASGPVSFMDVWDSMCRTIMSAGTRRGAMMATLRCDHPDIEEFIAVKADSKRLRMFNLSILVTDAFMDAVRADGQWDLVFDGKVYRTLSARTLWQKIMRATYDYAEPGVIFIDRVNALNNLSYCETIQATNPCGEQPLPPYGACLLGSINLARLVRNPFADNAQLDENRLGELASTAVRLLDNVIDVSRYPLEAQRHEALAKRRIGLGVTGLADALILTGKRYGSADAIEITRRWMASIERAAYRTSAELAREKGTFPLFDHDQFLRGPAAARLDEDVRTMIADSGLRNGLVTSIAPTGTISLFAGNVSSGVEPVFDFTYRRRLLEADGSAREEMVEDYAYRLFRHMFGPTASLPESFVTAADLSPRDHLEMQAALQSHVDSAISKTVNCPEDIGFEDFAELYDVAYDLGLKGCTTFRPNPVTGSVLTAGEAHDAVSEPAGQASLPLNAAPPPISEQRGDIVYMSEPLERDKVLAGYTYKLKWPDSDHAIYVTLNDIVQDDRRRPFEIFINSKNLEHYAWTVALTRMISAVFRRGGDVSFVVEELKAVFDPRGGQWLDGRYVPSLLAAIGGIIERHLIDIGFMQRDDGNLTPQTEREAKGEFQRIDKKTARYCPKCLQPALVFQEGCHSCRSCGYSKCS